MGALPGMLEHDRKQAGWSIGQAAWRLGVSIREYREIAAGERWPSWETYDRIAAAFGWPQTFVAVLWRPLLRCACSCFHPEDGGWGHRDCLGA